MSTHGGGTSGGRARVARGSGPRTTYDAHNNLVMKALAQPAAPRTMIQRANMRLAALAHYGYDVAHEAPDSPLGRDIQDLRAEIARYRAGDVSEPTLAPRRADESAEAYATRASAVERQHSAWLQVMGQQTADPAWRVTLQPYLDRQSDLNSEAFRARTTAESERRANARSAAVARGLQSAGLTPLLDGRAAAFREANGDVSVLRWGARDGHGQRLEAFTLGEREPYATRVIPDATRREEVAQVIGGHQSAPPFISALPADWAPPKGSNTAARLAREYVAGNLSDARRAEIEAILLGQRPPTTATRATPRAPRAKKSA